METLIVIVLFVMTTFMVIEASYIAGAAFTKVRDAGSTFSNVRVNFESIASNIKASDRLLAYYPSSGDPQFVADEDTTLIIRIPAVEADGTFIPNQFDVVIYEAEPVTGDTGPIQVNVYRARIIDGDEELAEFERVVLTNVASLRWTPTVNETFFGDTSTKTFGLIGTPYGSDDLVDEVVLVGGIDRIADGKAKFSGQKVEFNQAPNWSVPIDVVYTVNPAVSVTPLGENAANSLSMRMVFRLTWRERQNNKRTHDVTVTSRVHILNR